MFKNITFFRFAPSVGMDIMCRLGDAIAMLPLRELDTMELEKSGFVGSPLANWIGTQCYVTIATRRRVISKPMIAEILDKRVKEIEYEENRTVRGRERMRLKEDIIVDLMPRAPIVTKRVDCLIHCGENWIAVDSSSAMVAENCVSLIRMALGSFPARFLDPQVSPRTLLTDCLLGHRYEIPWALGDSCKLIDESKAVANYSSQELSSQEILDNLEAGKCVKQLGVAMRESVSARITTDLTLKSVKFLDGAGFDDAEDQAQILAMQALEIEHVARDLFSLFQCEAPSDE